MCNLEPEVLENLICGVSFCFGFFLKTTATFSWLFVMCRSTWSGLVRSKVYQLVVPGGTLFTAETGFPHIPDPEDGEEGCSAAAPWRRLAFPPGQNRSRSQPSHVAGTAVFCAPIVLSPDPLSAPPPGCVLHSASLSRPEASVFSSRKRGEKRCPPAPWHLTSAGRPRRGGKLCPSVSPPLNDDPIPAL